MINHEIENGMCKNCKCSEGFINHFKPLCEERNGIVSSTPPKPDSDTKLGIPTIILMVVISAAAIGILVFFYYWWIETVFFSGWPKYLTIIAVIVAVVKMIIGFSFFSRK